jgi:hypothetical protein
MQVNVQDNEKKKNLIERIESFVSSIQESGSPSLSFFKSNAIGLINKIYNQSQKENFESSSIIDTLSEITSLSGIFSNSKKSINKKIIFLMLVNILFESFRRWEKEHIFLKYFNNIESAKNTLNLINYFVILIPFIIVIYFTIFKHFEDDDMVSWSKMAKLFFCFLLLEHSGLYFLILECALDDVTAFILDNLKDKNISTENNSYDFFLSKANTEKMNTGGHVLVQFFSNIDNYIGILNLKRNNFFFFIKRAVGIFIKVFRLLPKVRYYIVRTIALYFVKMILPFINKDKK